MYRSITICGTAKDASGAAVPETEIRLVNLATNIERPPITTNQNGDFEIPDLQRGEYRQVDGFTPLHGDKVASDIGLQGVNAKGLRISGPAV
jgi:uncharacterized surface anchored protein